MSKSQNVPRSKPLSSEEYINDSRNWVVYLHQYQFSDHEGRLLTLIETLGLQKVQEDAVKSFIRQEVWKTWDESYLIPNSIKETIYASKEIRQTRDAFRG